MDPFEPDGTLPLEAGSNWLVSLLTGGLAVGLCVIAVALVGLLMMGGRVPVRTGFRILIGAFVLLGAPVIASAFVINADIYRGSPEIMPTPRPLPEATRHLPASPWDPYAGASLRTE